MGGLSHSIREQQKLLSTALIHVGRRQTTQSGSLTTQTAEISVQLAPPSYASIVQAVECHKIETLLACNGVRIYVGLNFQAILLAAIPDDSLTSRLCQPIPSNSIQLHFD